MIGNDWDNLVNILKKAVPATYTRVIMLNPLVSWLRPAVIHTNCTCNKFDHTHVADQWSETLRNFDLTLAPMGFLFIGRGSDGDARRYLLQDATWRKHALRLMHLRRAARMMQRVWRRHRQPRPRAGGPATIEPFTGTFPFSIPARGFTFACLAHYKKGVLIGITGCHSQDSIHKAKRLDMPLQWASKQMAIGNYVANALHLFGARNRMTAEQVRGLRVSDLRRDDRQNFAAVCRRSSNQVRRVLREMQTSRPPTETQGTEAVYELIHKYLLLFFSKASTLADRFEYGGYICQFLRLWYVSLKFWPDESRSPTRCFYPNQTFRHVLMSVQSALMYIILCSYLCPTRECLLHFLGSDCCEKLFAMVGGWGVLSSWQRNFDFKHFIKQISKANALFAMGNRGVWVQNHNHSKCEFDHRLHEDARADIDVSALLSDYPTVEIACSRFDLGRRLATTKAVELGIKHAAVPTAAWLRPWDHDPPNPDPLIDPYDEYSCRKRGDSVFDSSDSDYVPSFSSSSSSDESSNDISDDDDGMDDESDDRPEGN